MVNEGIVLLFRELPEVGITPSAALVCVRHIKDIAQPESFTFVIQQGCPSFPG